MLRRHQVLAGGVSAPLTVAAGWLFVLVLPGVALVLSAHGLMLLGPAVGIVVGTLAVRHRALQMTGALLLAVSVFSALMWSLLLVGEPAWSWLGSS